jgi:hypothetical protein
VARLSLEQAIGFLSYDKSQRPLNALFSAFGNLGEWSPVRRKMHDLTKKREETAFVFAGFDARQGVRQGLALP